MTSLLVFVRSCVIQEDFLWHPVSDPEILVWISRLWRRKKHVLSPHRKLCRGSEACLNDALGVHGALGVYGGSGLGVGVRVGPFCKLQNVPYL